MTSRGRSVVVVQDLGEFERAEEERELMRAVIQGLSDLEGGLEVTLAQARRRLGFERARALARVHGWGQPCAL